MSRVTDYQLELMKHTCGAEADRPFYRNYFITHENAPDFQQLEDLVSMGLMTKQPFFTGQKHQWIYNLTEDGINTVKDQLLHATAKKVRP